MSCWCSGCAEAREETRALRQARRDLARLRLEARACRSDEELLAWAKRLRAQAEFAEVAEVKS